LFGGNKFKLKVPCSLLNDRVAIEDIY
jgi:hypothetical protein